MSVADYNLTRDIVTVNGVKVLPRYNKVAAAKLQCRPESIEISETCANVSWKNLLTHTIKGIADLCEERIKEEYGISSGFINMNFLGTYGYDGSSGHSTHQQSLKENSVATCSMFSTHMVPISLSSSTGKQFWLTDSPSSICWCRPKKYELIKESKAHVMKEFKENEDELATLEPIVIILKSGRTLIES